ncbi:putative bifunctional diguanylate cyclase/phosphodiesterase [Caulobacter sp. KR2-114]|uniref:putative bifunctional diguanylate cyclase/phosphodiesterase n=1 Tax=Caulobacter sp. KR2-114 TaxID=3400912 RepID=UPI003C06F8DA
MACRTLTLIGLTLAAPASALAAPAAAAPAKAAFAAPAALLPAAIWMVAAAAGLVFALVGGVFVVLATRRANRLARTLEALGQAIDQVEKGSSPEVDTEGKGEAGDIARRFTAMASTLAERDRRIRHTAMHDAETGLLNRFAMEWRLTDLARKNATGVVMAAVSVDRLKSLHVAVGYEPAGKLLEEVAARLSRAMPKWPIGRISGDSLGVIFRTPDEAAARKVALGITEALRAPVTVSGVSFNIDVTVGLATLIGGDAGARTTVERALSTVDQARKAHRPVGVFDAGAYGDPAATLALMSEMAQAITAGDLVLHLQPRHDMRRGRTSGVEALVRWRHPRLGLLSPDRFVGVAETTGHIRPMTEWVLKNALDLQAALKTARHDLDMSINVPGRLLSDPEFIENAITAAAKAEGRIVFDVTESAVMENPPVALTTLERFSDAGIGIAIDDYGAGLSYLAHLKQIRADELKIDKAFVLGVADSQKDALVVRTTIALAHSLGMKVTAEGVETDAAYSLLAAMGCDTAQGFLIARPMAYEDLVRFLHEDRGQARRYG